MKSKARSSTRCGEWHPTAGSAFLLHQEIAGDYRIFYKDGGRVYGNIFAPRVARPVTSSVARLSVVATNCNLAYGLSTTLFVMGPDEGIPWLTNYPGSEALFILRNGDGTFSEVRSPGFPQGGGDQ